MKKSIKLIAVLLLATMLLSLVACGSTFGAIKRNFEKNGYEYIADEEGNSIFGAISAEFEEGDVSATFHLFKAVPKEEEKDDSSLGSIIGGAIDSLVNKVDYLGVIEFASDKEMKEALSESETLKGLVKDAQDSEYVNGNCILIPGLINIEEKVEIFNK